MRCCATCRGHRSPHWHRSRFPANGAALVVGGVCRSWGWPDGWAAQGPLQVRPCKLGRRIHAAHATAQPTHPATDSFRVRPPRKRKRRSKAEADRFARSEPSMARLYRTSVRGKLSKAGWVGWRGCEPHGCGDQASMDGFTASPAIRPTPPTRSNPAVAVASAGAGLQALQYNYVTQPAITSRARIASHSSSIRHTRLIASRRSGSRCHTGSNPASV